MTPDLDHWLPRPSLRVTHGRESDAPVAELWAAAREVRLRDAGLLGRLIRWRIPGTPANLTFDELFRSPPFTVLEAQDGALLSGLVGRIWTLRRDYPQLSGPDDFREWSAPGTTRVLFANWSDTGSRSKATLHSEVRVQAFGVQGRLGLATLRPLIGGFHYLVGSEGIETAVRLAER